MSVNSKKALAEKIKNELNSPEYVAMSDLITFGDRYGGMVNFVSGWKVHGNVHSKNKDNFISFIGDIDQKEKNNRMIYEREFEPKDWEEIVNLIEKRNEEKEQIWETKRKNIEQKLNQQLNNLYYYWGKVRKNERADGWHSNKGMRGYASFLGGNGNGLTHYLYIAENHPVLDNFSFQTGFYLIDNNKTFKKATGHYEGGFESSGGKNNPCNWKKYIETSDQITITPHQIVDKPVEKPSKGDKPSESRHFGGNEINNSPQSLTNSPNLEKDLIKLLLQYFQENNIKSIKLDNNELVITYNDDQLVKESSDSQELQKVSNYLQKTNKQELTREELNSMVNVNSATKEPKNNNTLLIGGGITILVVGVVIGFLVSKKSKKTKLKH